MSLSTESFYRSNLLDIMRALLNGKQTGYLKITEGEQAGFLAVENGTLINARLASDVGLAALFRFVTWRHPHFEFHERPIPEGLSRDLEVYDPAVLIAGVTAKMKELAAKPAPLANAA